MLGLCHIKTLLAFVLLRSCYSLVIINLGPRRAITDTQVFGHVYNDFNDFSMTVVSGIREDEVVQ